MIGRIQFISRKLEAVGSYRNPEFEPDLSQLSPLPSRRGGIVRQPPGWPSMGIVLTTPLKRVAQSAPRLAPLLGLAILNRTRREALTSPRLGATAGHLVSCVLLAGLIHQVDAQSALEERLCQSWPSLGPDPAPQA